MIKLIIDTGNTSVKCAWFHNKEILSKLVNPGPLSLQTVLFKGKRKFADAIIISSVINKNVFTKKQFLNTTKIIFLDSDTRIPLKLKYKTPETLGKDRIANATGGSLQFPGQPVLIIDAGTCLKFDFVDKKGNYHGGSIAPGLAMRFTALNKFTDKLPLLHAEKKFRLTGRSTKESIVSGVQMGILTETTGIIEAYEQKYPDLKIILTGGDYRFFAGNLKKHIFVSPNLTLLGLNEILDYNIP